MATDWVYSSGKVQLNNRIMNLNAQPMEFNNMAADPTADVGKWWIFAESDVLWAMDELGNKTPLTGSGAYDPHKIFWGTSNVEIMANNGPVDIDVAGTNRMRIATTGALTMSPQGSSIAFSNLGAELINDSDDGEFFISADDTASGLAKLYLSSAGPMYLRTSSTQPRIKIDSNGKISTGNEEAPDVTAGGLCLNQNASTGKMLTFKGTGNVSHPFTTWAEADTCGHIQPYGGSGVGGLQISGFGDTTTTPGLTLLSCTIAPSTGYAASGVFYLMGGKTDSGTSIAAIADTETLYSLSNVAGTPKLSILGNGSTQIGGLLTAGGETAPDCSIGGGCFNIQSNGYTWLTLKGEAGGNFNAHPFSALAETDTFLAVTGPSDKSGGAILSGYGQSAAIDIRGYQSTASTSTGPLRFRGYKTNGGTGALSLANTEVLANFYNSGTDVLHIFGNGDLYTDGMLVTGGESAPDCSAGGLCLDQNSDDNFIVTLKNSGCGHPFTIGLDADSFGTFQMAHGSYGGLHIRGYGDFSTYNALELTGFQYSGDDTETAASRAPVVIHGWKYSGAGNTASVVDNDENVFIVANGTSAKMILKGNGQLYNDYSTAMTTFDDHDDVSLVRAMQLGISERRIEVEPETIKMLQDLGVMNGKFVSHQKLQALIMGSIGQIFNMIKGVGKTIGLTEAQLSEFAKEY